MTEPAAWIDVYYPVLNTPLDRSLEILADDGNTAWRAELEEVADELDSDAHTYADSVGAWHGLSKDGVAEGRLLFANYGRKRDYDELVEKGDVFFLPTPIVFCINSNTQVSTSLVQSYSYDMVGSSVV